MDFSKIKQKAIGFKNKVVKLKDKTIEKTAKKVGSSKLVLKTQEELENFILKSESKKITTKEGEEKIFTKRCIAIFGDSKKEFFEEFLFSFPVLLTKGFSQNLSIKIVDTENKNIDSSKYSLEEIPAMIVFENKEIYKIIYSEEKIKKVVKSLSLDINKIIDGI